MEYINEYIESLYILEDLEYLGEVDLKTIIRKITPQSKLNSIANTLKKVSFEKPNDLLKVLKKLGIPSLEPSKADKKMIDEIGSDYKKLNKKAELVLKNSLSKADKKLIDAASTIVTLRSFMKMKGESDNLDIRFRENLKKFVSDSHYYESDQETEKKEKMPAGTGLDYVITITIITFAIASFLAIVKGIVMMVGIAIPILPAAICLGVMMWVATKFGK